MVWAKDQLRKKLDILLRGDRHESSDNRKKKSSDAVRESSNNIFRSRAGENNIEEEALDQNDRENTKEIGGMASKILIVRRKNYTNKLDFIRNAPISSI